MLFHPGTLAAKKDLFKQGKSPSGCTYSMLWLSLCSPIGKAEFSSQAAHLQTKGSRGGFYPGTNCCLRVNQAEVCSLRKLIHV